MITKRTEFPLEFQWYSCRSILQGCPNASLSPEAFMSSKKEICPFCGEMMQSDSEIEKRIQEIKNSIK